MAAKPDFNTKSVLECPICLSDCDDPQCLPCLHNLCKKCLQKHIKTSAQGSHFYCPVCRHQCEVPARGATALPAIGYLYRLSRVLRVQEKKCCNNKNCNLQHSTATAFCVECANYFCSNCKDSHNLIDGFREHKVLPAGEVTWETVYVSVWNDTFGTFTAKQATTTIPSNTTISSFVLSLKLDVSESDVREPDDRASHHTIGDCVCVTGRGKEYRTTCIPLDTEHEDKHKPMSHTARCPG